jgi:hypothetical protein
MRRCKKVQLALQNLNGSQVKGQSKGAYNMSTYVGVRSQPGKFQASQACIATLRGSTDSLVTLLHPPALLFGSFRRGRQQICTVHAHTRRNNTPLLLQMVAEARFHAHQIS